VSLLDRLRGAVAGLKEDAAAAASDGKAAMSQREREVHEELERGLQRTAQKPPDDRA
jgi:hypothetical protein